MAHRPSPLAPDVLSGDIGRLAVDRGPWLAVVSSDDSYLSHGGGSSLSIWEAAGYQGEAPPGEFSLPAPLGTIVESPPGLLDTSAVWHVVTIDLDTRRRISPEQIAAAFGELESRAIRLKASSGFGPDRPARVLLPLIGTRAGRVPEGVAIEQVASLSIRLAAHGIGCVIATLDDADRIRHEVRDRIFSEGGSDPAIAFDLGPSGELQPSAILQDVAELEAIVRSLECHLGLAGADPESPATQSMRHRWGEIARGLRARGLSPEPEVAQLVRRAASIRNVLVHGVADPDPVMSLGCQAALNAIRGVARRWVAIDPSFEPLLKAAEESTSSRRWGAGVQHSRRRVVYLPEKPAIRDGSGWRSPMRPPSSGGSRPPGSPASHGHRHVADHVDRLVDLLLELPEEDRDDLAEYLKESDYRGALELQVHEFCVRHDPREVLSRLSSARLRQILKDRFAESVSAQSSPEHRVERILHHLGFRVPRPLRGLEPTILALKQYRSQLATAEPSKVSGIVIDASSELERAIRDLIRFVCLHLFNHGPEREFAGHLQGAAVADFSKATLGTILHALEILARKLEQTAVTTGPDGVPHPLRELHGPLTAQRLAPGGVPPIAKLRNAFAHAQGDGPDAGGERLRNAREFFASAIDLLEHWRKKDSVYPTLIRIDRIVIDAWNRRTIEASTPEGMREFIVSDREIEPGATYFMYPLSNPMRVEPILIPFEQE